MDREEALEMIGGPRFKIHKVVRSKLIEEGEEFGEPGVWENDVSFAITRGPKDEDEFGELMADEYGNQDYSSHVNEKTVLDIPLKDEEELKKAICQEKLKEVT